MKTVLEILNSVLENFCGLEKTDDGYALECCRDRSDKAFDAEQVQAAMLYTHDYGGAKDAFQMELLDEAWNNETVFRDLKASLEQAIVETVMGGEQVDPDGFDFSKWFSENVHNQTFPDDWKSDRYVVTIDTGMTVGEFLWEYPLSDFSEINDEFEIDDPTDMTFKVRLTLEEIWRLYDAKDAGTGKVRAYTVDVDEEQCDPMREGFTIDISDITEITLESDSRYITEGEIITDK